MAERPISSPLIIFFVIGVCVLLIQRPFLSNYDFKLNNTLDPERKTVSRALSASNISFARSTTFLKKSSLQVVSRMLLNSGLEASTPPLSPLALLKCDNQTRCIEPELQLQRSYNVYYCKHIGYGVRFYFLVREGLLLHPKVRLVSTPEAADLVVYLPTSADWGKSECGNPALFSKLVVLDEGDGAGLFEPPNAPKIWNVLYFKRSYVQRRNGAFKGYMGYVRRPNVIPMTYTIADAYVRTKFLSHAERDIQLLCSLRGGSFDPVRQRIREWVQEYGVTRKLKHFKAGEVNSASRTVVSRGYFDQMHRSQVIVTSNPSDWEGDFRLMEAMASGALVFVDQMFVPRPHPLLDGVHVVYYDNANRTQLWSQLDEYFARPDRAAAVAAAGYLHAMRHHRAACLLDYILRSVHTLQLTTQTESVTDVSEDKNNLLPPRKYVYTGFQMRQLALDAATALKQITKKHKGRGGRGGSAGIE